MSPLASLFLVHLEFIILSKLYFILLNMDPLPQQGVGLPGLS